MLDLHLLGRRIYEVMAAYWETAEERNPSWFTTTWSENPTAIVPGDRVTHLVYGVSRRGRKASVVPADGDPPLDPW